ncbi:MAG: GNAT family N-acetyltransferase [Rhodobacteraceae bacterium]|jgi:GNAT superfamily N-acetyltransferase|nr:GNAT family N-acetyltransferase [Paracoccaceae bacterium]
MSARRIGPAEAGLWAGLRTQALAAAPDAFAGGPEGWAATPLEAVAAELACARAFVWEMRGRAVASAQWVADPAEAARGWVEAVFVTPDARGRGIAAMLLDALAEDAAAAGRRELWLEVAPRNRAALARYLHAGFRSPPPGLPPAVPARGTIALVRFLKG